MKQTAQLTVRWMLSHRSVIAVLLLVVTAASLWRVAGLKIDADMLNLLDPADPVLADYRFAEAHLPTSNALIVTLEKPDGSAADAATAEIRSLSFVSMVLPLPGKFSETVLFVGLKSAASDIRQSRSAITDVRAILAKNGLRGGFTGTPAFLVESQDALAKDLRLSSILTVFAVCAFFGLFYSAGWLTLLSLLPIGIGISWGLAGLGITTGRLTLLAAMVPTLLVGMGIDYSIHLLQSTGALMRAGGTPKTECIANAWSSLVRPRAGWAFTTAAAFLSLAIADLRGLAHMGWAGAATTIGTFLACVIILPLLLSLCPDRWLMHESFVHRQMGWLHEFTSRHRVAVLVSSLIVGAAALAGSLRVKLENDNSRLENPNLPARLLQERLARQTGFSTSPLVAVFDGFAAAGEYAGALKASPSAGKAISRIDTFPLGGQAAAIMHPIGNPFSLDIYGEVVSATKDLERISGQRPARMTGAAVVNAHIARMLRRDLPRVLAAALVLIVVVLVLGTRSVRWSLAALVPLAFGTACTGGMMGATGTSLSIMSVAVAPLILGIGVDDGVHMIMAWQRSGYRFEPVYRETGVAVIGTTVTTVAAFGSFVFCSTPALVQFGWQAGLGLSVCLAASLLVLPAVCVMLSRRIGSSDASDEGAYNG